MATSSTIPAVKAALVAALAAQLPTIHVAYQWDGAAGKAEMIWLDPFDENGSGGQRQTETIPNMKAGRKQRQETYEIVVAIQVVQPGLTPSLAAAAEARVYALFAEVESMLADDPNLGGVVGPTGVFRVLDHSRRLVPTDKGWVGRLDVTLDCSARLS